MAVNSSKAVYVHVHVNVDVNVDVDVNVHVVVDVVVDGFSNSNTKGAEHAIRAMPAEGKTVQQWAV